MNNILSKYEQEGILIKDMLVTEFSSKKMNVSRLWDLVRNTCDDLHNNISTIECSLTTSNGDYEDYDGDEEEFFDWLDQISIDSTDEFTNVKVCITP